MMVSQDLLYAMFSEATVGILVVNASGKILNTNPYLEKLFGYDSVELIGKSVDTLLPEGYRKTHVQHREKYYQNPSPRSMGSNLDLHGRRKDGTEFAVEISLSYANVQNEKLAIAYVNDVSKQKKILEELKEGQSKLNEAQAIGHVGTFEWNVQDDKLIWSDELYRMFGHEPQSIEMTFDKIYESIHPDDLESTKSTIHKLREKKVGASYGYRIIRPSGEIRHIQVKRNFELDANGNTKRLFGVLSDVTELTNAKEELALVNEGLEEKVRIRTQKLEESEDRLKSAQRIAGIGYWIWNINEEYFDHWSQEMHSIFELDTSDNVKSDVILNLVVEEDLPIVLERLEQVKAGQSISGKEFRIQLQDGSIKHIYSEVQVAKVDSDGNALELFGVFHDISKQKESEAALARSLEKEKMLNELKSRFVSMASHEFRTPLTTILSSSSLIERYTQEEQQDKRLRHIKKIESSVKNLNNILNDFLSLEKLESGKVNFNPVETDCEEFIKEVLEELEPIITNKQKIAFNHEGNQKIVVDKHLVRNVIINLLSNAIKYSPNGKVVDLITKKEEGKLEIIVKDQGVGIPEADHEHMFSRFFRATNVETISGTGLGLTIVKRYCDLMKGKIRFESEENEGTTFYVEIPQ